MASFEKAKKSYQKFHKERGQLKSRKKYGLLEKHKDYVLRAKDYHKKQNALKLLKEKALNKNPDEFYFKMISSKTKDGIHCVKRGKTHTAEALKHMKTQDLNYINSKRSMEAKKIEKLQASLHLLGDDDVRPVNQHVVFVDSEKEAQCFDAAAHFDTVPELVTRAYNRPTKETLKRHLVQTPDEQTVQRLGKQRHRCYEELRERIERERKMQKMCEELELQKHLMGKGRRVKIHKDEKSTPVYRWKKERKR
ncbi:probable U3 small nucleolar RNA-associated protein 11 [Stylophora pistillata]|uniref:U3 small nucleolar RNA-associated protein 11 n=1 Tax=Stylophora pistillata TaxID=50429 RepID=A0A2B4SMV9_STYPI|nr:probable U3 small nucleolar RNA-associated protein 11 [Stylophora pistillata]PFX31231.1 putative U3 small nucleolar RNA-associated protein 11 [Stylophora pistillata]